MNERELTSSEQEILENKTNYWFGTVCEWAEDRQTDYSHIECLICDCEDELYHNDRELLDMIISNVIDILKG